MLEEGDRLLRGTDLPAAYVVFKRGLEKAEKSGAPADERRVFLTRMFHISAARGNVDDAAKLFARLGGGANPQTMDVRLALELVILLQRADKTEDARALAEQLAQRLVARAPEFHQEPFHAIGWIVIDRVRTANVEITRAREASDEFVAALSTIVEAGISIRKPLPAALRGWITRYVDILYDSGRSLVAKQIAELVERIDQRTTASGDTVACIALEPTLPSLGCLADWPEK
jgi:hypothetical protein